MPRTREALVPICKGPPYEILVFLTNLQHFLNMDLTHPPPRPPPFCTISNTAIIVEGDSPIEKQTDAIDASVLFSKLVAHLTESGLCATDSELTCCLLLFISTAGALVVVTV